LAVLSTMSVAGDPDDLLTRIRTTIDPVTRSKSAGYGSLGSAVVRTDEGIRLYQLWETDEGRRRMTDDIEMRAAVREADLPDPKFEAFPVLSLRWRGELAEELSARAVDELWNEGRLDSAEELFAEDYLGIDALRGEVRGPVGVREQVEAYRAMFAGLQVEIEELVSAGDSAVTRWRARGTHTGELLGIAPTGKDVTIDGVNFARVRGGKIVRGHNVLDALGLLQQLGALPVETPARFKT
jgi:steroid delta-isomerase-like uncharacterized protein